MIGSQPNNLPPNLSRLHPLLVETFNLEELRTLCLYLNVRFDDLGGEGVSAKARELLLSLDRTKRIAALLDRLEDLRPHIDWRGGPLPEAICPYKGLHAFGEADKDNFFGRDEFTKKLVAAVNKQSLVAVVGPSGSGKSSVVFAGLLPALDHAGSWLVVNFRPGNDPFLALAKALVPLLDPTALKLDIPFIARQKLKPFLSDENKAERIPLSDFLQQIQEDNLGKKLLLIIDQFEELYTQVDQAVRRDFLDVLLAAGFGESALATPTHTFATLLLTMRADFMGQALTYPPMVTALQDNDVKIGLMSKDELALAIEQPALNQGVRFADGLVARILKDVGDHAGNLPLLEFALTLLWERQTNRQMTHDAYEAIGGVSGALAQHADETLIKLTQNDSKKIRAIQRVMVQLVQPGAGAEDTRRVARRADLGDAGWTLAQRLAAEDARLLVTGRDDEDAETTETVEVIHEALIQNWGRLQEWMETDREFRMWQERLRSDLQLWEKSEKKEGFLLQGAPLTVAADWLQKRGDELQEAKEEIAFIEASLRRQQKLNEAEEDRRQRELDNEKKASNRLRQIIGGLIIGLVLVGILIVLLLRANQTAQDNEQVAEDNAATAIASAATSDHNEGVALTREVEAAQSAAEAATARAEEAERATEANARYLMSQAKVIFENDPQLGLILALESLALADEIGKAEDILEESNGRNDIFQWGRSLSLGAQIERVALSPNESLLLVDRVDAMGELRDGADRTLIETLAGQVEDWGFSPDGNLLLVNYLDSPGELRDGIDGALIETLAGQVEDWGFSPDGNLLLVAYDFALGELRDGTSGILIETLAGDVADWEFSPDGSLLLVAYWFLLGELRDGADGSLIETLAGDVAGGEFSPDGSLLVVNYSDVPGELRDGVSGILIETLVGEVADWEFSSNESRLLVVNYSDAPGELRDGASGILIETLVGEVADWEFSSNESRLLVDYSDALGELRDGASGILIETLAGEVASGEFSPDGSLLVVNYSDAPGELRVGADGSLIELLVGEVAGWEFSPDGSLILVKYRNRLGELRNGTDSSLIETLAGAVPGGEFGPDGSLLLVKYLGESGELRNGADGSLIELLAGVISSWEFSPNENLLLIDYFNVPGELRDGSDGALVKTLAGVVSNWEFGPNGSRLWIDYEDGTSDLLQTPDAVVLAPLGTNLAATEFISTTQTMAVRYQDSRAYLLDLAWLDAMKGEVNNLPLSELIKLACQYPLENGAVLDEPEVRAALEPYLQQVGLEAPQACQDM